MLLCVATLASLLPALGGPLTLEAEAATTSQNNIVARADYMYDSTWICKKTVNGWRNQYTFYEGNTYRMPYGQPVYAGKYIGYGVSVDDYLSAAANSGSVFYTSRSNYAGKYSTYYATDCSAFVSWCWGISRQTTATIPNYSTYLGMTNTTNVYKLQLGDCLNSNSVGHVVLVTGLSYNSKGKISQIEITEQTPPQLKRSYYTPSQLTSKYGAYGIYRYDGTVPAAPGSASGTTTTVTTQYYPKCASSYTTFYAAMDSIGVSCDWSLHTRIAAINGISGFTGTAAQNTQLLNLLKAGKLRNPDYIGDSSSSGTSGTYYAKCDSSYTTFYAAMDSIGVSCDWELHCRIAAINGITNFTGTAEQNTNLLNLLKAGKLRNPNYTGDSSSSGTSGTYYAKCDSSYTTFYAAMDSIGVSCDWELHCRIAAVNGIANFTGTAEQNTNLLNLLKAGKLMKPGTGSTGSTNTSTPKDLVIGVNEKYIGAGYEDKIEAAFKAYMADAGYSFSIEYRTLGNSSTTVAELGSIINSAGDIDFVLGAGANIYTQAGVEILTKAYLIDKYNSDGKRYGALLTDKLEAVLFYNFVTGDCYHLYDNACDADCNACKAKRTASAHIYDNACDAVCNICGATRTVADHVYDHDNDAICNICNYERNTKILENIVVGINEKYIGSGFKDKIASAFSNYLAEKGYSLNIEYRTLGDSTTTAAQLGAIINSAGDIDFVLGAGANINTTAGVNILTKALLAEKYNSDGARYGALLTDKLSAVIFYNFVTGDCYHIFDESNGNCNICGAARNEHNGNVLNLGGKITQIFGYDTTAPAPVISGGSSVVFTADNDGRDEAWEINLGDEKLDPNSSYTVMFSLYNAVGNVGVGCVRDEYLSGYDGINTFYGNFSNPELASEKGYKIRVRRGFYEIGDIVNGSRTSFPYSNAYRDPNGYVRLKMNVKYNGETYVSTLYYLNKSSEWVAIDKAYVGISSSNTFGLYILHGSAAGCVAAVKDISYTIEDTSTNYSDDVTTPTIKLIDYNVQTGNTYYTSTANWLLSESPDIIGLQEVGPNWYKSLKSQLGGTYGYVGVPRSGTSSTNSGNEASPIFYKKSEYKLIDSGTKWLSNTPDTVGSKISGSLYIRVMAYAVLYHKDTGTIYIYVNTHLDNADSGSIRVKQMQILMDLVDELPNYPTILTGDLNGGLESGVINAIQNTHGYTNLAKKAAKKDSTYKTATFWETNSPCVIDYIFLSDMSKFNALSYKVGNSSSRCSVYKYSDHYALISTFNLK